MALEWRDYYAVGDATIDGQHKELFVALGKLIDAATESDPAKARIESDKMLEFLQKYVVYHFETEEGIQKSSGYPEYAEHKKLHEALVEDFLKIKALYKTEGPTPEFISNVNRRLTEWLMKHIGSHDKKLGLYLQKQRAMSK